MPKCIDKLKVFITYQNMDRYNYSVILAIHIYMSHKETAWFKIGLFNPLEIYLPHYKENKISELFSFPFITMPKIIITREQLIKYVSEYDTYKGNVWINENSGY